MTSKNPPRGTGIQIVGAGLDRPANTPDWKLPYLSWTEFTRRIQLDLFKRLNKELSEKLEVDLHGKSPEEQAEIMREQKGSPSDEELAEYLNQFLDEVKGVFIAVLEIPEGYEITYETNTEPPDPEKPLVQPRSHLKASWDHVDQRWIRQRLGATHAPGEDGQPIIRPTYKRDCMILPKGETVSGCNAILVPVTLGATVALVNIVELGKGNTYIIHDDKEPKEFRVTKDTRVLLQAVKN